MGGGGGEREVSVHLCHYKPRMDFRPRAVVMGTGAVSQRLTELWLRRAGEISVRGGKDETAAEREAENWGWLVP